MSNLIPIVENPRRRKKRRSYTAKQRAAGFGGKRGMKKRRTRKRRNPPLATILANPRRRRRKRYAPRRRRSYRRHRNPGLGGFFNMIDLQTAGFVAGGVLAAKLGPSLIAKVWPAVPRVGMAGHGIRLATILLVGFGVRTFWKSNQRAAQVVAGGIGIVLYDLFNEFVAPKLGLYGLGGYVTDSEIAPFLSGVSGYIPTPTHLGNAENQVLTEQMAM